MCNNVWCINWQRNQPDWSDFESEPDEEFMEEDEDASESEAEELPPMPKSKKNEAKKPAHTKVCIVTRLQQPSVYSYCNNPVFIATVITQCL